jgi:hypothetical protein
VEAVPSPDEVVVVEVVVVVAVSVEVVVAVEVVVVEATIEAELMDRPTAPRTANAGMLILTVEHVGTIAQIIIIVRHVLIKQQDIKMQQPEQTQWDDPQKTKHSQDGNDVVGSNKQIILKNKETDSTTETVTSSILKTSTNYKFNFIQLITVPADGTCGLPIGLTEGGCSYSDQIIVHEILYCSSFESTK